MKLSRVFSSFSILEDFSLLYQFIVVSYEEKINIYSFNRLLIKKLGITLPLHSQYTAAVKTFTWQSLPGMCQEMFLINICRSEPNSRNLDSKP